MRFTALNFDGVYDFFCFCSDFFFQNLSEYTNVWTLTGLKATLHLLYMANLIRLLIIKKTGKRETHVKCQPCAENLIPWIRNENCTGIKASHPVINPLCIYEIKIFLSHLKFSTHP